jgi:hypothetical protein
LIYAPFAEAIIGAEYFRLPSILISNRNPCTPDSDPDCEPDGDGHANDYADVLPDPHAGAAGDITGDDSLRLR